MQFKALEDPKIEVRRVKQEKALSLTKYNSLFSQTKKQVRYNFYSDHAQYLPHTIQVRTNTLFYIINTVSIKFKKKPGKINLFSSLSILQISSTFTVSLTANVAVEQAENLFQIQ